MHQPRSLDHYRLLGRSGLRVSPLSLGTMTFGEAWGWGADAGEAKRIFDAYAERGGNFIDTAVNYTNGGSERILGELIKDRRERFVLATKFTMARDADNINSGGNHRLNLIRSVQTSLRQLATDRIDLLYLHAWDFTTAPDEVMRGLEHLVQSGKVLYLGICNTPAWRVAQLQTLADLRGWSPLVALQIEYSLVERSVEHELLPNGARTRPGRVAVVAAGRWHPHRQIQPRRSDRRQCGRGLEQPQGGDRLDRTSQCTLAGDRRCGRCGRR